MQKNNLEIIQRVICQDEEAFQQLYEAYYKKAYYIAYRMTKSDADAQDAVQEAFIQIQRSIQDLKDAKYFEYWLTQIVLSKCKRIFRKNHYMSADPDIMKTYPNQIEQREYMLPEQQYKKSINQEILLSLIDGLPPIQKEVLLLAYFEQYKYKEIAQILKITENTVKSRVFAAKKSLKRSIEAYESRTQTKLKFHSLDFAIATALAAGYGIAESSMLSSLLIKQGISFVKTHMLEAALATTVCISGGTVITKAVIAYVTNPDPPRYEAMKKNFYPFQPVAYRNDMILTSKDAYFTLVLFANTSDQINHKNSAELTEIRQVYQELKSSNSPYYQRIIDRGLSQYFETLLDPTY